MKPKQHNPRPIRFPKEMEQDIQKLADKEHRSFHGQVLHLIQEALEPYRVFLDKKQNP